MSNILRLSLQENHALLKTHAMMLEKAGNVERSIQEYEKVEGESTAFLDEERKKLMNLAAKYDVWNDVIGDLAQIMDGKEADQKQLDALLVKISSTDKKQTVRGGESGGEGQLEAEICSALGIPTTRRSTSATKEEQDDEELAVVGGGGLNTTAMICPLTGSFLEDPVKNSRCGHAYSKNAILVHLQKSSVCPVAGCGNKRVLKSHLVPDLELIQQVRRQKRRRDAEEERIYLSQAWDVDDDMEAEEDGYSTMVTKPLKDE